MRLSAKADYACRAVVELALRYNGDAPVRLSVISQSQRIPRNFLTQLLIRLKNAGIVNSARGISGGYSLARHPSLVTLLDVLKAIDSSIVDRPKPGKPSAKIDSRKIISDIMDEISAGAVKRLQGITLEAVAAKLKNEQPTYYI